jgi:O-antigen/teichoic acid export membrane protein
MRGKPLLGIIYGDFYREGAIVLALLSLGQIVNVWAGSCGLTLMMTGHQRTMMGITVACGFFVVAGAIWLVEGYGAAGVAAAAALAMILQNITMVLFAKQNTVVWTYARPALIDIYKLMPR